MLPISLFLAQVAVPNRLPVNRWVLEPRLVSAAHDAGITVGGLQPLSHLRHGAPNGFTLKYFWL